MTLRRCATVLFVVPLLGAVAFSHTYPTPQYILAPVDTTTYVVCVSDSAQIYRLPLEFRRHVYGLIHIGDSGPALSPDSRWIAFVRDYDLWLLDLVSREQRALTRLPHPQHGRKLCRAFVTQWAADGRRLLYCVGRMYGDLGGADCPVSPTYYVYDTVTGESVRIELPGLFECWLPNGDYVLTIYKHCIDDDEKPVSRPSLSLFTPQGPASPTPLIPPCDRGLSYSYGQVVSNRSGTRLAMLDRSAPDYASRIIELDLVSGQIIDSPTLAGCNRCQWPS